MDGQWKVRVIGGVQTEDLEILQTLQRIVDIEIRVDEDRFEKLLLAVGSPQLGVRIAPVGHDHALLPEHLKNEITARRLFRGEFEGDDVVERTDDPVTILTLWPTAQFQAGNYASPARHLRKCADMPGQQHASQRHLEFAR